MGPGQLLEVIEVSHERLGVFPRREGQVPVAGDAAYRQARVGVAVSVGAPLVAHVRVEHLSRLEMLLQIAGRDVSPVVHGGLPARPPVVGVVPGVVRALYIGMDPVGELAVGAEDVVSAQVQPTAECLGVTNLWVGRRPACLGSGSPARKRT